MRSLVRVETPEQAEKITQQLPIFSGTMRQCNEKAIELGYRWRECKDLLFGGFFTKGDGIELWIV